MFTKERIKSIGVEIAIFLELFLLQYYQEEISSFIQPYTTVLFIVSLVGLLVSCLEQFQQKKWTIFLSCFSYMCLFGISFWRIHLFFEKYEWIFWGLSAILLYLGVKYNVITKLRQATFTLPRFLAVSGCYMLVFLEVFFKLVRCL